MLTLGDLGQATPTETMLSQALAPYIATLKDSLVQVSKPAALAAVEASMPRIHEEFNKWIPTIALLIGVSIGASMLIGTQLPRWNIGK